MLEQCKKLYLFSLLQGLWDQKSNTLGSLRVSIKYSSPKIKCKSSYLLLHKRQVQSNLELDHEFQWILRTHDIFISIWERGREFKKKRERLKKRGRKKKETVYYAKTTNHIIQRVQNGCLISKSPRIPTCNFKTLIRGLLYWK